MYLDFCIARAKLLSLRTLHSLAILPSTVRSPTCAVYTLMHVIGHVKVHSVNLACGYSEAAKHY